MPSQCQHFIANAPDAWQAATVHPFLDQCKTGEISPQQFNTWLVQDYQFVLSFTRFAAHTLASAAIAHYDVLLGGLAAIKEELLWFQAKAAERDLTLDIAPQPTCAEYCHFMDSLANKPYAVKATAFWAIELAYNQGWQKPGEMVAPYNEFADRWGNSAFTDYVKLLEQQADEALAEVSEDVCAQAEAAFLHVARLEQDFWQMAYAGS